MESAVDMQLRLKALCPPSPHPNAESIRRESQSGQQRQSAEAQSTRVPRWDGGQAGHEVCAKKSPSFVSHAGRNCNILGSLELAVLYW